jgi:hypothetical protein
MKLAHALSLLTVVSAVIANAGETRLEKQAPLPSPLDDRWRFSLAMPGWMAGIDGDIGINGVTSSVGVNPGDLLRRIDMAALLRGEASRGRFGIMADFLYLSLSDGIGTETMVKKVDIQVDQVIGELALRWRLIDSPRGWLDVYGGLRYTNLFQQVVTQPNSELIGERSTAFVDAVSERLRAALGERLRTALSERLEAALSEGDLRSLVQDRIVDEISSRVPTIDPRPPTQLPVAPIGDRLRDELRARITAIVEAKKLELAAAIRDGAEAAAIEARARIAAARERAAAARLRAQQRIDGIKRDLSKRIARELESRLDRRVARTDDWWDPFIGLRGRLNLSEAWYLTAKGDIGGFGVGADFAWQAEAALGCQLTRDVFAEVGYRALGVDYDKDGLIYDVITHGAQITVGIKF